MEGSVSPQPSSPEILPQAFVDTPHQPLTPVKGRIDSIEIKGLVLGTDAAGDHFGFVSPEIGSFKALGFSANLTSAIAPDVIEIGHSTGDVTIREV